MCICHSLVDLTLIIPLSFLQRDSSDNMEASIVLSGEFMYEMHGSSYIGLVQMWLKGPVFVVVFLLGALDFLQKPVVAFVRLKDSMVMESALESPIPVRFVFVLAGPNQGDMDYRETGRAMGALMADWVRRKKEKCSFLVTILRCRGFKCLVFLYSNRCSVWRPTWRRPTKK